MSHRPQDSPTAAPDGGSAVSIQRGTLDPTVRAALGLDDALGDGSAHGSALSRLVEERTVALIAAHEEIEQAHRRRQELRDRMRFLSAHLGASGLEGADLVSTLHEIADSVGQVLDVDVVAIYTAGDDHRFDPVPVIWHAPWLGPQPEAALTLTPRTRQFLEGVAARRGTLALGDISLVPDPPDGTDEPGFLRSTGYRAWILSPVHDVNGGLLATLGLARLEPVSEWSEDDIALVDSVGADLGRAIVQANLYERQSEVVRQLQDLDRAKSEFLSTFSHELRTPLTSIRAYTELLRDGDGEGDPDRDHMLEIIEKNSMRLSNLIEDILTLSHLNSAVYAIRLVPVDANPLLASVCDALGATAEAKQLTLRSRTADRPAMVLGDADQLERLLLNLVSNAIKFTPAGGTVLVTASATGSSVVLSVSDDGIGIPVSEQEAVFGRFFRGAEAAREVIPGTGLGLAIVQAIVEHHDGTLAMESAPGLGTTIRVELPAVGVGPVDAPPHAQGSAGTADTEPGDRLSIGSAAPSPGAPAPLPVPQSDAPR